MLDYKIIKADPAGIRHSTHKCLLYAPQSRSSSCRNSLSGHVHSLITSILHNYFYNNLCNYNDPDKDIYLIKCWHQLKMPHSIIKYNNNNNNNWLNNYIFEYNNIDGIQSHITREKLSHISHNNHSMFHRDFCNSHAFNFPGRLSVCTSTCIFYLPESKYNIDDNMIEFNRLQCNFPICFSSCTISIYIFSMFHTKNEDLSNTDSYLPSYGLRCENSSKIENMYI